MKHDSDIIKQIKNYFMRRKSSKEAYSFEQEIERDGFLYEAIEGFENMHVSDVQQSLDELEVRIDNKVTPNFYDTKSFRIAAAAVGAVLAISIFGILGFNNQTSENSSSAARTTNPTEPATQAEDEAKARYKARANMATYGAFEPGINDYFFEQPIDSEESMVAEETTELEPAPAIASVIDKVTKTERSTPASAENKPSNKNSEPENSLAESDNANEASVAEKEVETYEDEEANDDAAIAAETTEKANTSLSEAPTNNTKVAPDYSVPSPSNGYGGYQRYIQRSLNKTEAMSTGTVVLTFEFNKKGEPKKIAVTKSLCPECDAEAIRLIQNGPAWNVNNESRKSRVSYTIAIP